MKGQKILAILGSPHSDGTTAAMLDLAVRQAEEAGCTVTRVNLYERDIAFCRGCEVCYQTRSCVIDDDMREISALLRECDTVILAAPVYWANVPAAVKNMFDRLLGVAMEKTRTFPKARLSGRKYLILTACHTPAPFDWLFGQSRGAIRNMEEFFKTAGMKPAGRVVCAGRGNQKGLPEKTARKVIRKIARLIGRG